LNRKDEARVEFERAAALTRNARERELLMERARSCAAGSNGMVTAENNKAGSEPV
jgi:predicted RNA polymerase sigma factor